MIRTYGLTKAFGPLTAVDGVDLDVREGDVYGFLGANGSGKTTTVRMVLGLVLATKGTIELFGESMPAAASTVLPRVGALVEGPAAYPHLAVAPTSPLRRRRPSRHGPGPPRPDHEVLEQVGLDPADRRPVRTYSLGMRQRLGLAAALLRRPPLLVLDEPTNGLDPQGIREIRELLVALNASGTTIFLSSHLLAEIEQMCTRVGVLDRGRLVLQEQLDTLTAPTGRIRVRTPDVPQAIALLDGRVETRGDREVVVRGTDAAELNASLVSAGVRVEEIGPVRRLLEDVVLEASEGIR